MARQPRILFPGAWYHVMNRGANHQSIFIDSNQRKLFLSLLQHISTVYKIEIHAYCLMTNHYHLLIRTPKPNLPEAMRYLDSVYAAKFNKYMGRDGPLFRGRFKSVLVDADEYLIHVARYIHLNPLEAKMVDDLSTYRWSSYPLYLGIQHPPQWLHLDFVLGYFSGEDIHKQYKSF